MALHDGIPEAFGNEALTIKEFHTGPGVQSVARLAVFDQGFHGGPSVDMATPERATIGVESLGRCWGRERSDAHGLSSMLMPATAGLVIVIRKDWRLDKRL